MKTIGMVTSLVTYIEVPDELAELLDGDWNPCDPIDTYIHENNVKIESYVNQEAVQTEYYRFDL